MKGWVLDSSMALAWGLPDERSPRADSFLKACRAVGEWHVPALWWSEIANALCVAERRRRITEAEASRLLDIFGRFPVKTEPADGPGLLLRCHSLAKDHGISAYDATYLDLAQRKDAGLATLDEKLARAARKAGVGTP